MNFQTYCLRYHGYEAYSVQFLDFGSVHTVCIYKDKNTGKWNAIDYGCVYSLSVDSFQEILNIIYPGWVQFRILDTQTGNTEKIFVTSTKQFIQKWLED